MRYIKYSIFVIVIFIITAITAFASNADEIRTIELSVGNEYMYVNEEKVKYYEDLMKTFSLKTITGDNVMDMSIIKSMANIE